MSSPMGAAAFRVYVNHPNNRATVHHVGCSHWHDMPSTEHGYWSGNFSLLVAAWQYAEHSGKRPRVAGCCPR